MAHDDIKNRLTLILQRIESNKYSGIRMDPDFVYLAEKLNFALEQNEILLQALDAYGGHEADSVVDYFKHPLVQPDSF